MNKSCKNCGLYPCFQGIDKCRSDFGKYNCKLWRKQQSDQN